MSLEKSKIKALLVASWSKDQAAIYVLFHSIVVQHNRTASSRLQSHVISNTTTTDNNDKIEPLNENS